MPAILAISPWRSGGDDRRKRQWRKQRICNAGLGSDSKLPGSSKIREQSSRFKPSQQIIPEVEVRSLWILFHALRDESGVDAPFPPAFEDPDSRWRVAMLAPPS